MHFFLDALLALLSLLGLADDAGDPPSAGHVFFVGVFAVAALVFLFLGLLHLLL